MRFDPHRSWLPLEERARTTSNPRHRTLLTAVRDHMEHEIKGNLEALMDTLTAEPVYHFWGNGPVNVMEGRDAVTAFYQGMIDTGTQQFEVVVERIAVDDNAVITEGRVRQVYSGVMLQAMGTQEVGGEPVTPEALYLADAQLLTVWPGDAAGKLIGEDIYFGENPMDTLTPIGEDELPAHYVRKM